MIKMEPCAVIIVTHNSENCLAQCIRCLENQTIPPNQIIIVDSGSKNTRYLEKFSYQIYSTRENIGFCAGNNIGYSLVYPSIRYVLFLNPDAFLTPSFLEQALNYMENSNNQQVGALSGLLLGYDLHQQKPSGKIDSSGIFQTWYGRWFDRGQGETYLASDYHQSESVPALCGALMFCRKKALDSIVLKANHVMDPSFFMYKEDIDLSLRLRCKGWDLKMIPWMIAYHCRGWQKNRSQIPKYFRLLSARNERRLHARTSTIGWLYSTLKYLSVKWFNV